MRLLILPALAIIVVVAGAVAVIQPWQGDDDQQATAETRKFAVCNVVVEIPVAPVGNVSVYPWDKEVLGGKGVNNVLAISVGNSPNAPAIYFDAETGQRMTTVGSSEERRPLDPIAATVRLLRPEERGWPYSDKGVVKRASNPPGPDPVISWRSPDSLSGLQALPGWADSANEPAKVRLTLQGCHSRRTISVSSEGGMEVIQGNVVAPEDQAAFDAFFAEVSYRGEP